VLALVAFAGNSVLCRLALVLTDIDPASFSSIRLASGAVTLWLIVRCRRGCPELGGSWSSASALFVYAAAFSFAYVTLPTGAGELLLFGAVQATMIGAGLWAGERMSTGQWGGFVLALGGLVTLLLPGLSSPPLGGSLLMLAAGLAWGIYSLQGRHRDDPSGATAGNFLRTLPLAELLSLTTWPWAWMDGPGIAYAMLSGALASGVGYAVWYDALRGLTAARAATVQLTVPVLAALGGGAFLGEPITVRQVIAAAAILSGVALVLLGRYSHQVSLEARHTAAHGELIPELKQCHLTPCQPYFHQSSIGSSRSVHAKPLFYSRCTNANVEEAVCDFR
jgi:drug/metabolite transporter (DMT)-like permease